MKLLKVPSVSAGSPVPGPAADVPQIDTDKMYKSANKPYFAPLKAAVKLEEQPI